MRIDVVTLMPELVQSVVRWGVTGRAAERGLLTLDCWMKFEPLRDAIDAARGAGQPGRPVVYLSPQGRVIRQAELAALADGPGLVLVSGRYEGIDERIIESRIEQEWSIGDYVLSGGELAAMVIVDALARLLPGALGDAESARQDSFADGLLDCPHYTRPEVIEGRPVPPVLLSGDHQAIARWRRRQALERTWRRRPDLLAKAELGPEDRAWLASLRDGDEEQ